MRILTNVTLTAAIAFALVQAARAQDSSALQSPQPMVADAPTTAPPQDLQHRPEIVAPAAQTVALSVPKGTPLEVALDKEIRVERAGQPVHGRIVEPVYAFDKLVIPVGAEVTGRVTQVERVSTGQRTADALNADFTPARKVQIAFDDVQLPNGKQIALQTLVTPGSGRILDFVGTANAKKKTVAGSAAEKAQQAKEQARREFANALEQIKSPGKVHRAEHYALAQLPVHPQFIDAGSIYFAELQSPLDFGAEPLAPETARSLGEVPPDGSVVHARLETGLSSAKNQKGDPVQAVITQPLFESGRLILPEGSTLAGDVVQVGPARRLSRNGELRMVFHELRLPDGVQQKVEASLESVQAGKSDDVKLDSEGGAHANAPKTRYLSTAVSLGLAGLSVRGDPDAKTPDAAGNASNRAAGGLGGYKLIGITLGILVHSRAFGYSMGAYGAGVSVYSHFIARGHDVVFPQDTATQISLGTRESTPGAQPATPNPIGQ